MWWGTLGSLEVRWTMIDLVDDSSYADTRIAVQPALLSGQLPTWRTNATPAGTLYAVFTGWMVVVFCHTVWQLLRKPGQGIRSEDRIVGFFVSAIVTQVIVNALILWLGTKNEIMPNGWTRRPGWLTAILWTTWVLRIQLLCHWLWIIEYRSARNLILGREDYDALAEGNRWWFPIRRLAF